MVTNDCCVIVKQPFFFFQNHAKQFQLSVSFGCVITIESNGFILRFTVCSFCTC